MQLDPIKRPRTVSLRNTSMPLPPRDHMADDAWMQVRINNGALGVQVRLPSVRRLWRALRPPAPAPQPPALSPSEAAQALRMGATTHADMAELLQPETLVPVSAATRQAFHRAWNGPRWVDEASALQLFARYERWAQALALSPQQRADWDMWMAGYAAAVGCQSDSVFCVRSALADHEENAPRLAALRAFVQGETSAFPAEVHLAESALCGCLRAVALGPVGLRLQTPLPTQPTQRGGRWEGVIWEAALWDILMGLPREVQPRALPFLAAQPNFQLDTGRMFILRMAPGSADVWARTVMQLSPEQQRNVAASRLGGDILQEVSPEMLLALLDGERCWPARFWRASHVHVEIPPAFREALRQRVPPHVDSALLQLGGPLETYFPDLHWQLVARARLGGIYEEGGAAYEVRDDALESCLARDEALPECPDEPELALVQDPATCVATADWGALLQAWGHLPGLSQMLQNETPKTGVDAQFAQANRLQALGRVLFIARETGADLSAPASMDLVHTLLRLPCQPERHTLLLMHLRKVIDATARAPWLKTLGDIFATHTSHDARVLAVALAGLHDMDVAQPDLQAILRSRAVAHEGATAHRLLALAAAQPGIAQGPGYIVDALFGWADATNLFGLLIWSMQQDDPLTAVQCDDQARGRACLLSSENTSLTATALLAYKGVYRYRRAEHGRLLGNAAWMQSQQDLRPVGEPLMAYVESSHAAADLKRASQAARALPRGLRRSYCETLCQQAQRFVQVVAKNDIGVRGALDPAFWQLACTRQFVNRRVMPMLLLMEEHRTALTRGGIHEVRNPDDVFTRCYSFLSPATAEADIRTLKAKVYHPTNLSLLWDKASTWGSRGPAAELVFKRLIQALLDGTETVVRRETAQMQAIIKHPLGQALLPVWEADHREVQTADGKSFTVEDTSEFGKMLAAVTEIGSCQSVHRSDGFNIGMVGRMQCGSKHMLTLRDDKGVLRARAALRMMLGADGAPVLAVSRIFTACPPAGHVQMLHAYVVRRAASMGVVAVTDYGDRAGDVLLTSQEADVPDYYDGGRRLATNNLTFGEALAPALAEQFKPA